MHVKELPEAPLWVILCGMILRPQLSLPRHDRLPGAASAAPMAPVPAWLRRAIPDAQSLTAQGARPNAFEDVALAAGAAICALDQVVRREEKWAGAWRRRLALAAAAVAARQAGRLEDETALRDAVLLTRPGDSRRVAWTTAIGPQHKMI